MSDTAKGAAGATTDAPDISKFVPKEDYDKTKTELEKLQGDLEKVKGQLLDPEYLEYLESKKNKAVKELDASTKVKAALGELTAEEIESLPKARLIELVESRTTEKVSAALRDELSRVVLPLQRAVQEMSFERELAATREKFPDFDKHRDVIQRILERPGTQFTYEDAYLLAKAQAGETAPAKGEPEKTVKRSSSEKPSSSVATADMGKKDFKSSEEAGNDALAQIREKYNLSGDTL